MDVRVLAEAVALAAERQPFVLASVIWRRGPSSGQQGSKAVILSDGTIRGWLGGACAASTVEREALAALADGEPRRLLLGSESESDDRDHDGRAAAPMACESDGAMEVYLEPMVPAPQAIVIGRSPAVDALATMATALDWTAVVIDDETKLDLSGLSIDAGTAIVVATQGHYDDAALTAALRTDAGYIGLISSDKRAAAVKEHLRQAGIDDAQLARIHAPAGLDLGRTENLEIAAAVIADLVARRARGELRAN